jgi:hypothetical protein
MDQEKEDRELLQPIVEDRVRCLRCGTTYQRKGNFRVSRGTTCPSCEAPERDAVSVSGR